MKKQGALVGGFLIALFCFFQFGCGSAANNSSSAKVVTIWHWMTDRHEALLKLAKQYEEQTGVKVVLELYAPSDTYSQKIVAAAQAKSLPDIFGILDKKQVVASFIESGFVANLSEDFKANNSVWQNTIFPKALAVNQFEDGNIYKIPAGIYGVPIDIGNIQMLYNKNLLKKAGFNAPPKTFDEFLKVGEALKKIGVAVFVSGWGELWMADAFASNYAFNIMGEEKVMATYRGEVPYTDPNWIKVFEIFKTLKDNGMFIEGIVTKPNKFAEQDFALQRAAFAYNGSWCVNVYNGMNPKLEYGAMLPPAVASAHPMRIWGGANASFFVNNISPNKALAIDFLKWLSGKDPQIFLATETKNLPSNKEALSSIPSVLSEFASAMDFTTHPTIWKHNELPLVIEAFDKGLQSIVIGEKTPQQVAEAVQGVKTREMNKIKSRAQKN